jgi:hypothetical protein
MQIPEAQRPQAIVHLVQRKRQMQQAQHIQQAQVQEEEEEEQEQKPRQYFFSKPTRIWGGLTAAAAPEARLGGCSCRAEKQNNSLAGAADRMPPPWFPLMDPTPACTAPATSSEVGERAEVRVGNAGECVGEWRGEPAEQPHHDARAEYAYF